MTLRDPNNPTPAELETLRVECAKEAGTLKEVPIYQPMFPGPGPIIGFEFKSPAYSTSYDAILPKIQKLDEKQKLRFIVVLGEIMPQGTLLVILDSQPWQLALAWLRTKQQNKKES